MERVLGYNPGIRIFDPQYLTRKVSCGTCQLKEKIDWFEAGDMLKVLKTFCGYGKFDVVSWHILETFCVLGSLRLWCKWFLVDIYVCLTRTRNSFNTRPKFVFSNLFHPYLWYSCQLSIMISFWQSLSGFNQKFSIQLVYNSFYQNN